MRFLGEELRVLIWTPDPTRVPADEQKDEAEILECIRLLRRQTGWGITELSFKGGNWPKRLQVFQKSQS